MTLHDLSKIKRGVSEGDTDIVTSPQELKLLDIFARLELRGKRDRAVPILLSKAVEDSLHVLAEYRQAAGVASDNPYVFAVNNRVCRRFIFSTRT